VAAVAGLWGGGPPDFAVNVDCHMFDLADPESTAVAEVWSDLDSEVREICRPLSWPRFTAAGLSLRSIHRHPPRPRKVNSTAAEKAQLTMHDPGGDVVDAVPPGPAKLLSSTANASPPAGQLISTVHRK